MRDLQAGPVAGRPAGEGDANQLPRRGKPFTSPLGDPHGHGQHLDVARSCVPPDGPGHGRRARDALRTEREAVHHHVRQVHGAQGDQVTDPATAVDEGVVVTAPHVAAQRLKEPHATEELGEVSPAEAHQMRQVLRVPSPRGHVVEGSAAREGPIDRNGVRQHAGMTAYHVRLRFGAAAPVHHIVREEIEHSRRRAGGRGVEERVEIAVQAGRLDVPVRRQDAVAVGSEDPGHIGQCHGPSGAALLGVEGDDLSVKVGGHRMPPRRVLPAGTGGSWNPGADGSG